MGNELFLVPGDVTPPNRDAVKALVRQGQAAVFSGIRDSREVVGERLDLVWFDEPSMNGWARLHPILDRVAPSGVAVVTTGNPERAAAARVHGFEVLRI